MMDSIPRSNTKVIEAGQSNFKRLTNNLHTMLRTLILDKGGLLCIVGFLLGRAVILSVVSTFAVAFLATLWVMKRDIAFIVMIVVTFGDYNFILYIIQLYILSLII